MRRFALHYLFGINESLLIPVLCCAFGWSLKGATIHLIIDATTGELSYSALLSNRDSGYKTLIAARALGIMVACHRRRQTEQCRWRTSPTESDNLTMVNQSSPTESDRRIVAIYNSGILRKDEQPRCHGGIFKQYKNSGGTVPRSALRSMLATRFVRFLIVREAL
jgi:hypothetical protein